jgi:eukaryotic-like serine/threonine-protein kinase
VPDSSPTKDTGIVPGAILAGKYRVERVIGMGGMGLVVEARHIALDERVALKFLLPEYAQHPEAAPRFMREARIAAKIKSEHVVRVSDVGALDNGAPYMMMEYLEGADLAKTLETLGVFSVEDAVDYILQGCEAIAEAHQHGIVHRDLKPANLFLSKRPDGTPLVKVLDFGISKISDGGLDNLTKTTAAMGSALYMSPEQMQQTRAVDHRTDIYALGIALYELLAGQQPYYADTLPQLCAEILTGTPTPIRSVRSDITEELARVIEKAYARDKAQRHQSIADLVIALAPHAPTRSQQMIDRVARMAGLPIPAAGTAGQRASSPPRPGSAPSFPQRSGTQLIPQPYAPAPAPPQQYTPAPASPQPYAPAPAPPQQYAPAPASPQQYAPPPAPPQQYAPPPAPQAARASQPGSPATEALSAMDPMAARPPPPDMGPAIPRLTPVPPGYSQIVPDHYQAPASSRASKHFRLGSMYPQTDGSMSAVHQPSQGGGKAGMVIAILGVLVIGAGATALLLRPRDGAVAPASGLTGRAQTTDTAAVRPPETAPLPTAPTAPPPSDVKSAPPAVSAAEPPAKAPSTTSVGNGTKAPVKGAPTAHPSSAPTTAPVVKPPVNPLDPGGRQGLLLGPTKDRPT